MKLIGFSLNKLAILSSLTLLITGFTAASFTLDGIIESDGDKYTTGNITINGNNDNKVGLWQGNQLEEETVEKQISGFEGFDETKPDPGSEVDLGVIYSDGEVNFGDEIKIINGSSGEEVDTYYNLNVRIREDGSYYFTIPDHSPTLNFNDNLIIDRKLDETATDQVNLAEEFGLQKSHGKVKLYESTSGEEKTVYVDNSGLEFEKAKALDNKTFELEFQNKGKSPIDYDSIRYSSNDSIRHDIFDLSARTTKLGSDENLKISEVAFNREGETFTINLENKFSSSDKLDISTTDKLRDILGNEVESLTKTVGNLYSERPEVSFQLNKNETNYGEAVEGSLKIRSLDEPNLELSTESLDIVSNNSLQEDPECLIDGDDTNYCYEKEIRLEYDGGESGTQEVEVTATNQNGYTKVSDSVDVITKNAPVEEILVYDTQPDGKIDKVQVRFNGSVDASTFEPGQWKINEQDLSLAEGRSGTTTSLNMTVDNGIETTDANEVKVTHSPGAKKYLEFDSGIRVEQITPQDITEKDRAGPVLKDIEALEGYDHGVLEFSEPVKSVEPSPNWDVEIVKKEGKNTDRAVAKFEGTVNEAKHGGDGDTWTVEATDIIETQESGNQKSSSSEMSFDSNLIGLTAGTHVISLPEAGSLVKNEEGNLDDQGQYSWVDSAFNYDGGWRKAEELNANRGTYINVDRAGIFKFESSEEMNQLPDDLQSNWNLLSPFMTSQSNTPVGLFNQGVCENNLDAYNPKTREKSTVDCEEGEDNSGLDAESVFKGYWVG